jgi:hypothetical protein
MTSTTGERDQEVQEPIIEGQEEDQQQEEDMDEEEDSDEEEEEG